MVYSEKNLMNIIRKKKEVIRDDINGVFETIRILNNESLN